jgi:Flp pilus assembly CpaE family ATPase
MADIILEVVVLEPAAIRSAGVLAGTFEQIGYPSGKVQYLVNRVDLGTPELQAVFERTVGRPPDHVVESDPRLAGSSVLEGVPFVLAHPDAAISRQVQAVAATIVGATAAVAAGRR